MSEFVVAETQNFWLPIHSLVSYVEDRIEESKDIILEITSFYPKKIFRLSTESLNWIYTEDELQNNFLKYFEHTAFIYMRHALEKMDNPRNLLKLFGKISRKGYIETTSPLVEALRGMHHSDALYRGHALNKYIIWTSETDHTLHILPKYPILEHVKIKEDLEIQIRGILTSKPHYWNCYYEWSEEKPLKYMYYQHGINFNLENDYARLLEIAIEESVKSINAYLSQVNQQMAVEA